MSTLVFCFVLQKPIMSLVKVFRQRELQGTLRITNEFNEYVQDQLVSFEEWCNFICMEYDRSI
jgi:hemerythrin superfamily protein